TVGDSPEIRLSLPKETFEPLSEFRREDLLRVALAHRRHDVRRRDRARHQIGLATIFDRQTRSRKSDELQNVGARPSLVREVVDREHGGGFPQLTGPRSEWDEKRGMPVMRVHHVGRSVDEIFDYCAAEERVAFRIVVVAVDLVAADAHTAHEHGSNPVAGYLGIFDTSARRAVRYGMGSRAGCRNPKLLCVYRAVIGHVDSHVVSEGGKGLR